MIFWVAPNGRLDNLAGFAGQIYRDEFSGLAIDGSDELGLCGIHSGEMDEWWLMARDGTCVSLSG